MSITAFAEADVETTFVSIHSNGDVGAATAMAQLLSAELETAKTLMDVADTLGDSAKRARCVAIARRAHDTALRFLPRTTLTESESERIREVLDLLRSRLEALGESFDVEKRAPVWLLQRSRSQNAKRNRSPRVEDEVQRFLAECEQIRGNAQEMLRQNKALMERDPD